MILSSREMNRNFNWQKGDFLIHIVEATYLEKMELIGFMC